MKTVGKISLQGLATILPIAITIYILYWLGWTAEDLMKNVLRHFLGEGEGAARTLPEWYKTGYGILVGFVCVFAVGLLMKLWLIRSVFGWGEAILGKMPLVKTLYGSVRDLMGFFSASGKESANQVVMVSMGDSEARLIGVLTREDFSDLPEGVGGEDAVAVYLPMSYQVGGFTAVVPRSTVRPVQMSMEEAMRFAVTAGMSTKPTEGSSKE